MGSILNYIVVALPVFLYGETIDSSTVAAVLLLNLFILIHPELLLLY